MGGKTSKSTQTVSVPADVLARYNSVNARASAAANTPFERYSGQFVAPLTGSQLSGMSNINAAAGMAQPYFGNATNQLMSAQQGVAPYYENATNQLNQGVNAGNQFAGQSSNTLANAQNIGSQFAGQSSNTINAAQDEGGGIQRGALNNLGAAYSSAQPYNEAAGNLYQQGLGQGSNITGQALSGTQQALSGAQPYQGMATQYMNSGAQAVNPGDLGAEQINKYMSPYLQNVLQGTAGLLNQQNQQQQAGQMGNAIRSGAFGGDRGGIAAANLNQQQNLANAQIFSGLLNQGYGQALNTAQQQQQLGLGASQANRAAQQQASQQALAIGQQGFGQGLSAAQQQGALGQQLFNMNTTTGQNAAALGQQVYGQGTNTAQQQSNVGNTLFNQGATTAAQQAALGQQQFGQGATAAAQQAALGQQQFNQGNTAAGTSAALGQGLYNIGANTSSQLAALGTGAQNAAIQGGQAQMNAGQVEQATKQAENTALLNQFKEEKSYPFQVAKFESDIAQGTGALSGSQTTTAQPGGFFSDARLKENVQKVGKTYDGQHIYRYNYKGDPTTQIGLIAQEVERHHPDAVGSSNQYRTVDYDKATDKAADRGHFYAGGLVNSMGGSVSPMHAGQGYADGGLAGVDPSYMAELYRQLHEIAAGRGINGMKGIPTTDAQVRELMLPRGIKSGLGGGNVSEAVDAIDSIGELGDTVGAWNYKDKEKKAFGGEVDDPEDKKRDEEAGLAKAALEQNKPDQEPTGLSAPVKSEINPITPVKIEEPKAELKFGEKTPAKKLAVATAPVKPTNHGSETIGDLGKLVQIGATLGLSDKRMKENIRPIGELFDGQKVHSFNYKGDPRTQIGLIAQEVERHRPSAVDHIKGMKTVDYHNATQHAVNRGHFAEGGMPEEGMDDGLPPVISPGLVGIHRKLNPLAAKMANFQDRLDQERYFDLHNLDNKSEGLGAADASPPPAENMLQRDPMAPKAGAPKAGAPKQPSKPGLTAPIDNAPLPKSLSGIAKLIFAAEGDGAVDTSSALGRYGIVKGTYVDYFKKAFPQQARELGDAGIKALRTTPEGRKLNLQFGPMIIADNAKTLSKAGFDTDARNVYLAHFLGPAGAVRALRADPNTPVELAVNKESIDANPDVFKKRKIRTVGELLNWTGNTMAKRAQEMSRKSRAEGGLAGRDGYAEAGVVALTPEEIAEKERREAVVDQLVKDLPVTTIGETPGTSKTGQLVSEPPKVEGLGAAIPPATAADPSVAVVPSIAPGLVGTNPKLAVTNGAVGAASNVAGTAPVAGLAGAQAKPPERANVFKRVLGLDPARPYDSKTNNKFFQRLGHGETDAVLSALKGLAAMGTAPTRSLGVALSAGIGAGADAFQGQREFGRKTAETAAQTMSAEASKQQAQNGALEAKAAYQTAINGNANNKTTWLQTNQPYAATLRGLGTPDLQLEGLINQMRIELGKINQLGLSYNVNSGETGTPPTAGAPAPVAGAPAPVVGAVPVAGAVTPPVAGAATPTPPTAGEVGPGGLPKYEPASIAVPDMTNADDLRAKGYAIMPFNPTLGESYIQRADLLDPPGAEGLEKTAAYEEGAIDLTRLSRAAQANNTALIPLIEFEKAVDLLPEGFQGPFADQLVKSGAGLNQIATAFGLPAFFDPAKIANAEDAQKAANRLRDALTAGFNGTAGSEVMEKFVGSSPSLLNTKEGAKRLISGVRQANKAVDAEYRFSVDYKGNPRLRGDAFRKAYPPRYWLERSKADFYFSNNKKLAAQIKADPSFNFKIGGQTARQYFDKNYAGIGGAAGVFNLVSGM